MTATAADSQRAVQLLRVLPPEAIAEVAAMLRDIVQTSGRLKEKHADFVRDMERFREISDRREQTIRMLSSLLLAVELEQSAKLRLVDTICELALR